MDSSIRVLVLHQNCLFRECLTSVLSENTGLQAHQRDVPASSEVESLRELGAGLILLEMTLPLESTTERIGWLKQTLPGVKVAVLVPARVEEAIVGCVQVGADGCVLDEASIDELKEVIEIVSGGQSYCSPQIANSMFAQLGRLARENRWSQRVDSAKLTTRELEILRLIAEERLSNKQIALKLKLSLYTVKNHVHNILEKLQVENRYQAVEYAYEQHLL